MTSQTRFTTENQPVTSKYINFAEVKGNFSLPEVVSAALNTSYKSCGTDIYQLEPDECPNCGHKGCFKIICQDAEDEHYHCFSCEVHGDIFNFLVDFEFAENFLDAAKSSFKTRLKQ